MPRTSLCLLLLTTLVLAAAGPAVAALGDRDDDPVEIPLQRNLRMVVRPTLMGLVPPADPRSYGELFLRVTAVEAGTAELYYEVKEALPDEAADDGETTRIRRGDITATGLLAAGTMVPPMFWPEGGFTTDSSLVWLSRSTFNRLKQNDRVDWRLDFASEPIPAEFAFLNGYLARLSGAGGDGEDAEWDGALELVVVDAEALYPCVVNGERVQLPALRMTDSLGLAEYWVLNDPRNPLVLKLSFLPPAEGLADDQPLGLVEAGAGYAVVNLDF